MAKRDERNKQGEKNQNCVGKWEAIMKGIKINSMFALALTIQSCSSTEDVRFEEMNEYELIRYNLLQSAADQIVCFGPSRGFIDGRFQRKKRECFSIRELETYTSLTRRSPHDARNPTGSYETDNSDF